MNDYWGKVIDDRMMSPFEIDSQESQYEPRDRIEPTQNETETKQSDSSRPEQGSVCKPPLCD